MRKAIRSKLDKLVGLNVRCAGRASNLFWLGFGEKILVTRRGKTEEVAEYALHIQCSWRIVKGNKIVVASRDFYSPRTGLDDENEYFEWDVQGNNRFDEPIEFFIEGINEHTIVERVDSDEVGGLKIFLSQGYLVEVFRIRQKTMSIVSSGDFSTERKTALTLLSQEKVLKTSNRIIKETKKAQTRWNQTFLCFFLIL
ncbi:MULTISPECIES: hypothetical protein [Priestia]|uniref:hypothetical protein n=1 Tax=Priestia TaxID=2800373 RepID=UPI000AFD51B5|nr:hypothetical protein [Priestia aryabhattai]